METENVKGTKVTYKTSKDHTLNVMFDFFKKTSIPRIIAEHKNKSEKQKSDKAI